MQTNVEKRPARTLKGRTLSGWLDLIFSQPYLYAVFALVALNIRVLQDVDTLLAGIWHKQSFPLFRMLTYAFFTLVLAVYLLVLFGGNGISA